TEISQEFLEALPPEIRREILEQQAIDRHFRELNRQGDNAGTQNMPRGPTAGETPVPGGLGRGMPPTFQVTSITDGSGNPLRARDFFATLDIPPRASQRHQFIDIFMPTDGHRRLPHIESSAPFDVIGNSLASHFTTGLGANQPPVHRHMADELLRRRGGPSSWKAQSAQGKDVLTPLLDRRELAVLARLLFLPTHLPDNHALNKLMSLLCEVAKTRGDLIALLLSVLQDNAQTLEDVDRCLGHLVQRGVKTAVTPSKSQSTPKGKSPATFGTPTTTATTSTGTTALPTFPLANVAAHTGPNLPAQCSLLALNAIVNTNHNIPRFFLTENDHLCLCKPTKKGKAREKSIISKYPVVILLSLLDRPHILRNP
ncbi:E3 ubiquitin-protein ligase tom1, partial [Dispira parvispora]